MIITQSDTLNYSSEAVSKLAHEIINLPNKQLREALLTYLSGRVLGSTEYLKTVGKIRGSSKSSQSDFVYSVLEVLESEFISDEDPDNLFALKNTLRTGEIITNKFGHPCYISHKETFQHDDEISDVIKTMGKGEVFAVSSYLFDHERKELRSPSQDNYVRKLETATSGSRLEFCELNPDKYRIFYFVKDTQNMPMFIFDRNEKRFINYTWGQPNSFLRPFHEDTVGVDMSERLLTRNNENDHSLEVCIEYGCTKTKENNYKNKKRSWRPFSEYWNNATALVRETGLIQGVISVKARGLLKMTIPDINSALIAGNLDAVTMDGDGSYDDVTYNQMVNFNPHKVLIQIASNDKKGLGLRDSDNVTVNQRLKAAEILYGRLPRNKPAQKPQKSEEGDSSHVVVTFPEKEGYKDEGKKRIEVGLDETQAIYDFVSESSYEVSKEHIEG